MLIPPAAEKRSPASVGVFLRSFLGATFFFAQLRYVQHGSFKVIPKTEHIPSAFQGLRFLGEPAVAPTELLDVPSLLDVFCSSNLNMACHVWNFFGGSPSYTRYPFASPGEAPWHKVHTLPSIPPPPPQARRPELTCFGQGACITMGQPPSFVSQIPTSLSCSRLFRLGFKAQGQQISHHPTSHTSCR